MFSLNAAKWSLFATWGKRLLGLVSTIVLLKILSPYDFGIAATAILIQGLTTSLTEAGLREYLITKHITSREQVSSCWLLSILFKSIASIALFIIGIISLEKFNNDLGYVILSTSILPLISGLKNPGLILDEINDNFKNLSMIPTYAKIVTVPVVISLAFYLKNYWSVVIGTVVETFIIVFLSFKLNKFRPIINSTYSKEMLSYSFKFFFNSTLGFLRAKTENFAVLSIFGTTGNGKYTVSQELAYLPFTEIVTPLNKGFLSVVSRNIKCYNHINKIFNIHVLISIAILLPFTAISFLFSDAFVKIFFNEQWFGLHTSINYLLLISIPLTIILLMNNLLVALDNLKALMFFDFILSVFTFLTVFTKLDNLNEFIYIRGILVFIILLLIYFYFYYFIKIKLTIDFHCLVSISISALLPFILFKEFYSSNVDNNIAFSIISIAFYILTYILSNIIFLYYFRHNSAVCASASNLIVLSTKRLLFKK